MSGIIWQLPTMTRNALQRAGYDEEMLDKASDAELLNLYSLSKVGLRKIRELQGRLPSQQKKPIPMPVDNNRLWLAGTIAAGLCADGLRGEHVAQQAVKVADMVLEELAKGGTK
jgi:hypothetical protein